MKKNFIILLSIILLGVLFNTSCQKQEEVSVLPSVNNGISAEYKMEFDQAKKLVLGDLLRDGIMFQQNKPANVYGKGIKGQTVKAELILNGEVVEDRSGIICDDGSFVLALSPRTASFDEYMLKVTSGENERVIKRVMFGDVYLAGGQSNMAFKLQNMANASDYLESNLNSNIRIFQTQELLYGSSGSEYPLNPQMMLAKGEWIIGDQVGGVNSSSAIGFVFASEIYKKLKEDNKETPIGIIDISVGGSTAENWLGRQYTEDETIEKLKSIFKYVNKENWNNAGTNNYTQYSAGFNTKVSAIRFANINGMIWYQGESNVFDGDLSAFETVNENLVAQFSDMFGFTRGTLPVGVVSLATFSYSNMNTALLADMWVSQSKLAQSKNAKVSIVTIYDLPTEYFDHEIHPKHKIEIGERLAYSIYSTAYGGKYYTAPYIENCTIDGKVAKLYVYCADQLKYITESDVTGIEVIDGKGNTVPITKEMISINSQDIIINAPCLIKTVQYNYHQTSKTGNLCDGNGMPLVPFKFERN